MSAGLFKSQFSLTREWLRPPLPKVLNLQANDVCNARCVMCNIWAEGEKENIPLADLGQLLTRPYFSKVEHVGVTGGEPTLRKDLAEIYRIAARALPSLQGASFITNGFLSDKAVITYQEIAGEYQAKGLSFSGMVSIDGVGEVHDRVRGRKGAFEKATATLDRLISGGLPVHACCTIVRNNIYGLHDLLAWAKEKKIYMRFRVGTFIRRLYNAELGAQIRSFDRAEEKHLVSFFHKLLLEYEQDERIRRTYESILSILSGGMRLTDCPYLRGEAMNVDNLGRVAVCAPQGETRAARDLRSTSRAMVLERRRLASEACQTCIHDYHAPWNPLTSARRDANRAEAERLANEPVLLDSSLRVPVHPTKRRHLLVVGWYGSETAGDIAILGGLLLQYARDGFRTFTVFSLWPYYSLQTLQELARELGIALHVKGYDDAETLTHFSQFDLVSMGGGPLMDIEPTLLIRNIFRRARAMGIPCHIDGCSIGPLHQERYAEVVAELLRLATRVHLRDARSCSWASAHAGRHDCRVIDDPSIDYLRSHSSVARSAPKDGKVRAFFRMLTHEYRQDVTPEQATAITINFLVKFLEWYPNATVELCSMHWFPVGWDDREFARELARRIASDRLTVDMTPRTPKEILNLMAAAELNLCMRFHSVVFAHTARLPFVAFDYTGGGKIPSYLAKYDLAEKAFSFPQLAAANKQIFEQSICLPAT